MKQESINISNKELISSRFKKLNLDISEYSFANLFMFQEIHPCEFLFTPELFIKSKTRDGHKYLMPTVSPDKLDFPTLPSLLQEADFFFPIPEQWLPYFDSSIFKALQDYSDSDYLYAVEKMRTYPGRHLAGRRNLVKQFRSTYNAHIKPITLENTPDAKRVLEVWRVDHSSKNPHQLDIDACQIALSLLKELDLNGSIVYIDDIPVAFFIGESLNERTYVIHFAKADVRYKGIYQYLYQECALQLDNHHHMINLEQDLGDLGIRQSKRSYLPDLMLPKFKVMLK